MRQNANDLVAKKVIKKCEKTGRVKVYVENNEPSKTDPSFQKDCDVNHILDKYMRTGELSHRATQQGQYGDFSQVQDFHQAMTLVQNAKMDFEQLPPQIRYRFRNKMENYVAFIQDSRNDEEAIKLGLKIAPKVPLSGEKTRKKVSKDGKVDSTNNRDTEKSIRLPDDTVK